MRKLHLTSLNPSKLPTLLTQPPSRNKLAFIPTAADPYEDKWFMEADLQALTSLGFQITVIDIKNKSPISLKEELQGFEVVHVAGGNSFYLLEQMQRCGFREIMIELLDQGVVYSGASAGAVVVGPSLDPIVTLDDPAQAPGLTSFEALNLVNFVILPHYGKEKYLQRYEDIMEQYSKMKYELKPLRDDQVILVEGDSYRVVEIR